jgi:hypothetical protein
VKAIKIRVDYDDGSAVEAVGEHAAACWSWIQSCEVNAALHGAVFQGVAMTQIPAASAERQTIERLGLAGEIEGMVAGIEAERAGFIEKQLQFDHDRTVFADTLLKLEQKSGREIRELKESLNFHGRLVAALLDSYEQEILQHQESSEPK